MSDKLITLNDLARQCGYFERTDDIDNNGYTCLHDDQTQRDNGIGLCLSRSCPVAIRASMADLRRLDADLYIQYCDEFPDDEDTPDGGEDWMVIESEVAE